MEQNTNDPPERRAKQAPQTSAIHDDTTVEGMSQTEKDSETNDADLQEPNPSSSPAHPPSCSNIHAPYPVHLLNTSPISHQRLSRRGAVVQNLARRSQPRMPSILKSPAGRSQFNTLSPAAQILRDRQTESHRQQQQQALVLVNPPVSIRAPLPPSSQVGRAASVKRISFNSLPGHKQSTWVQGTSSASADQCQRVSDDPRNNAVPIGRAAAAPPWIGYGLNRRGRKRVVAEVVKRQTDSQSEHRRQPTNEKADVQDPNTNGDLNLEKPNTPSLSTPLGSQQTATVELSDHPEVSKTVKRILEATTASEPPSRHPPISARSRTLSDTIIPQAPPPETLQLLLEGALALSDAREGLNDCEEAPQVTDLLSEATSSRDRESQQAVLEVSSRSTSQIYASSSVSCFPMSESAIASPLSRSRSASEVQQTLQKTGGNQLDPIPLVPKPSRFLSNSSSMENRNSKSQNGVSSVGALRTRHEARNGGSSLTANGAKQLPTQKLLTSTSDDLGPSNSICSHQDASNSIELDPISENLHDSAVAQSSNFGKQALLDAEMAWATVACAEDRVRAEVQQNQRARQAEIERLRAMRLHNHATESNNRKRKSRKTAHREEEAAFGASSLEILTEEEILERLAELEVAAINDKERMDEYSAMRQWQEWEIDSRREAEKHKSEQLDEDEHVPGKRRKVRLAAEEQVLIDSNLPPSAWNGSRKAIMKYKKRFETRKRCREGNKRVGADKKMKLTDEEVEFLRYSNVQLGNSNLTIWRDLQTMMECAARKEEEENLYQLRARRGRKIAAEQEEIGEINASPRKNSIERDALIEEETVVVDRLDHEEMVTTTAEQDENIDMPTDFTSKPTSSIPLRYHEWGEKQWDTISSMIHGSEEDGPKSRTSRLQELSHVNNYNNAHKVPETPMKTVQRIMSHFERSFDEITCTFYPQQIFYGEFELELTDSASISFVLNEKLPKIELCLSRQVSGFIGFDKITRVTMVPPLVRGFPPCLILGTSGLDDQIKELSTKYKNFKPESYTGGIPMYQCHPDSLFFVLDSNPMHKESQCTIKIESEGAVKCYKVSATAGFEVLDTNVQLTLAIHPQLLNLFINFDFLLDFSFWDYVFHLRLIWILLVNKNGEARWMAKCREDLLMVCDSNFIELDVETGRAYSLYPPTHRFRPLQRESNGSLDRAFACREPFPIQFRQYPLMLETLDAEGDDQSQNNHSDNDSSFKVPDIVAPRFSKKAGREEKLEISNKKDRTAEYSEQSAENRPPTPIGPLPSVLEHLPTARALKARVKQSTPQSSDKPPTKIKIKLPRNIDKSRTTENDKTEENGTKKEVRVIPIPPKTTNSLYDPSISTVGFDGSAPSTSGGVSSCYIYNKNSNSTTKIPQRFISYVPTLSPEHLTNGNRNSAISAFSPADTNRQSLVPIGPQPAPANHETRAINVAPMVNRNEESLQNGYGPEPPAPSTSPVAEPIGAVRPYRREVELNQFILDDMSEEEQIEQAIQESIRDQRRQLEQARRQEQEQLENELEEDEIEMEEDELIDDEEMEELEDDEYVVDDDEIENEMEVPEPDERNARKRGRSSRHQSAPNQPKQEEPPTIEELQKHARMRELVSRTNQLDAEKKQLKARQQHIMKMIPRTTTNEEREALQREHRRIAVILDRLTVECQRYYGLVVATAIG